MMLDKLTQLKDIIGNKNFLRTSLKLLFIYHELMFGYDEPWGDANPSKKDYYPAMINNRKDVIEIYNKYGYISGGPLNLFIYCIDEKYKYKSRTKGYRLLTLRDNINDITYLLEDRETMNKIIEIFTSTYYENSPLLLKKIIIKLIILSKCDAKSYDKMSSFELVDVLSKLMPMEKKDTCLMVGTGFISFLPYLNKNSDITIIEKNRKDLFPIRLILLLLKLDNVIVVFDSIKDDDITFKFKKFNIVFSDSLLFNTNIKNKGKINEMDIILQSLEKLDSGIALFTVSNFLLNSSQEAKSREILIEKGLKLIVSLPLFMDKSKQGSNLILIEKNYQGDIKFIDGAKLNYENDDIKPLIDILQNDSYSDVINTIDIQKVMNDSLFTLIEQPLAINVDEGRRLSDIERELKQAYDELKKIL